MAHRPRLAFAKPRKRDRPGEKRKREIKKKDREFQEAEGTEGHCEACGTWSHRTAHHIKHRRIISDRWDPRNIWRLCHFCHTRLHSQGEKTFVLRFPHLLSLRMEGPGHPGAMGEVSEV